MRHRTARPSLAARLSARAHRARLRIGTGLRRGGSRLALGLVLALAVTGLVLAAPVVSGAQSADIAVDASSSASPSSSPVVMGIDGKATSSNFESASASVVLTPEGTRTEASGRGPANPATGAGTPTAPAPGTSEPAPAEEPAAEEVAEAAEEPAESPAPAAQAAPPVTEAPAAPQPVAAAQPAGGSRQDQVLALVNRERAAAGCGAVSADAALAAVAAAHSADMRDRSFFAHVNLSGQDPFDRARVAGVSARAENIAQGQPDPAAVMTAWMNSSGHRANILDCSLTRLGVGVADGGGGPWWTQLFG